MDTKQPQADARHVHANLARALQPVRQLAQQWEQGAPQRDAALRAGLAELHQSLVRGLTAPRR